MHDITLFFCSFFFWCARGIFNIQHCFDPRWLSWDLTHFLCSIEAPFLTFDNHNNQLPMELIFDKKLNENCNINNGNDNSYLTFPYPMPDLYTNRPLVLKFYVENPNQLQAISVNGCYLKKIEPTVSEQTREKIYCLNVNRADIIASRDPNKLVEYLEQIDNFAFEILLANEELNYWQTEYWFKQNNWLFKQKHNKNENENANKDESKKQEENKQSSNNRNNGYGSGVADFDSTLISLNHFVPYVYVDINSIENIIVNLSDRSGIPSLFSSLMSLWMNSSDYDQFTQLQFNRNHKYKFFKQLKAMFKILQKLHKVGKKIHKLTSRDADGNTEIDNAIDDAKDIVNVAKNVVATIGDTMETKMENVTGAIDEFDSEFLGDGIGDGNDILDWLLNDEKFVQVLNAVQKEQRTDEQLEAIAVGFKMGVLAGVDGVTGGKIQEMIDDFVVLEIEVLGFGFGVDGVECCDDCDACDENCECADQCFIM